MRNGAGILFDDSVHYLDHLAPFCSLLKWPLIICEPSVAALARAHYADLEILEMRHWKVEFPEAIVSCVTRAFLEAVFPHKLTNVKNCWLPHGNSDKGWKGQFFEALQSEKKVIVYGQKMIDLMAEKGVCVETMRVGNYRWEYFEKHREFYTRGFKVPSNGKNYLYAPTWDDVENNGSFWQSFPHLAETLPGSCNLLVKLHPNTWKKYAVELEILIGRTQNKNIRFLPEFPPIYPLISIVDAYIGDMSSIGYDFLKFNKPMFFIKPGKHFLFQCGQCVSAKTVFETREQDFTNVQKRVYETTFDPCPCWDRVAEWMLS